jgi:hypothetical protein
MELSNKMKHANNETEFDTFEWKFTFVMAETRKDTCEHGKETRI